jgi:hypothetical protein
VTVCSAAVAVEIKAQQDLVDTLVGAWDGGWYLNVAIGYDRTETVRTAVLSVPEDRWVPAVSADGSDERDSAEVAEITDLLDLLAWPEGTRAIVRREDRHPGAQLSFTDIDGRGGARSGVRCG